MTSLSACKSTERHPRNIVKGRNRHIVVDTLGLLLAVYVRLLLACLARKNEPVSNAPSECKPFPMTILLF
jgi:hypothetical protein